MLLRLGAPQGSLTSTPRQCHAVTSEPVGSSTRRTRAQRVTVIVRNVMFSMMPPLVGALKNRNQGVPAVTVRV
jgi:hypothetical protein